MTHDFETHDLSVKGLNDMLEEQELRLFIAMPYSDLGDLAKWKKPVEVEKFYEQVRKKLSDVLQRPVRMRIEKYSPESGLVIDRMFRAIAKADIFIADLTGWNVNVALELGFRFGVSKKITILTSQEDRSLPFDLNQMRFVRYANRVSQEAEDEIVSIVQKELDNPEACSPVLRMLDLEVVPRGKWEVLAGERVNTLLEQSQKSGSNETKLDYVLQAVDFDPFSHRARLALAKTLRLLERFDDAVVSAKSALNVFPGSTDLHKELGLIFDRMSAREADSVQLLDKAAEAYSTAMRHCEDDADLYCCYGGVLRRKGFASSETERKTLFDEALRYYQKALQLDRHSTYAGLNVTRLLMLMSADSSATAKDYMRRMYHLCSFEVTDSKLRSADARWWQMFDLADVLAMMNDTSRCLKTYETAISQIPPHQRKDTLVSPKRTWQEMLRAGVMKNDAEKVIELLENSTSSPT